MIEYRVRELPLVDGTGETNLPAIDDVAGPWSEWALSSDPDAGPLCEVGKAYQVEFRSIVDGKVETETRDLREPDRTPRT